MSLEFTVDANSTLIRILRRCFDVPSSLLHFCLVKGGFPYITHNLRWTSSTPAPATMSTHTERIRKMGGRIEPPGFCKFIWHGRGGERKHSMAVRVAAFSLKSAGACGGTLLEPGACVAAFYLNSAWCVRQKSKPRRARRCSL